MIFYQLMVDIPNAKTYNSFIKNRGRCLKLKFLGSAVVIFFAFVLPVAASLWLALKRRRYLRPILFGALTFTVFQGFIRLPLLQLVIAPTPWYTLMTITNPLLSGLFLSITAALFEEGGRYIVMRLFLRNNRRYMDGIAFGIGHGGAEALLLGGLNALIVTILNIDLGVDPLLMAAGGVERLFAIVCHVAFSVMVLQSINHKNLWYFFLAILSHTLLNLVAVLMQAYKVPVLSIETVIGGFALFMLMYTITAKNNTGEQTE
jgi:uncharacterized membrane protein YhfC